MPFFCKQKKNHYNNKNENKKRYCSYHSFIIFNLFHMYAGVWCAFLRGRIDKKIKQTIRTASQLVVRALRIKHTRSVSCKIIYWFSQTCSAIHINPAASRFLDFWLKILKADNSTQKLFFLLQTTETKVMSKMPFPQLENCEKRAPSPETFEKSCHMFPW